MSEKKEEKAGASAVQTVVSRAKPKKPLGHKSYGSIPHLPNSRLGPGDHKCSEGQATIATQKKRDKHDLVICQEKVDGGNVGVAKIGGEVLALGRVGYLARTSPFDQHHLFADWVDGQKPRFEALLDEGERLCGEWLALAHGTKYDLSHEPFVAFDLMRGKERTIYAEFNPRVKEYDFVIPQLLSIGEPISVEDMLSKIETSGHGAIDPVEGAVWRVERNRLKDRHSGERLWVVDFLVKYVRPDKVDGVYLPEQSGKALIWNWHPLPLPY